MNPPPEQPDGELAQKIHLDHPDAFDAVYRAFGARVLGFALRLSGNRVEAEDLVQDVFVAAYDGRAQFRKRSGVLTWLLGITARRWRDRCRYHSRRPVGAGDEALLESRCSGIQVEDHVVQSVTLDEALMALDPPFREALLLVHSQGLSYREAAEALGEPVGTVKWRVFEATRALRRQLEAVDAESGSTVNEAQVRELETVKGAR